MTGILGLCLLIACSGTPVPIETKAPAPIPTPAPTNMFNGTVVTAEDKGKTIVVAQTQSIRLELPSNPSTGYRWKFVAEPDAGILKLMSTDYIPSNTSGTPLVGSGGTDVWNFQAVAAGTAIVKLGHFPPANPNQAADTFEITVTVK